MEWFTYKFILESEDGEQKEIGTVNHTVEDLGQTVGYHLLHLGKNHKVYNVL